MTTAGATVIPLGFPYGPPDIDYIAEDMSSSTDLSYWNRVLRKLKQATTTALENSTALRSQESVTDLIRIAFRDALEESFEDGMENEFSLQLTNLLRRYKEETVDSLAAFVTSNIVNDEISAQALRCLVRLGNDTAYTRILWLLERSLHSESPRIRDAAALSLASLDDPQAIPYLRLAIDREPYMELRLDMEQVLAQLESTLQCP